MRQSKNARLRDLEKKKMFDESNVSVTLFNSNAPYITDGKGNYTFSLRSLAILLNSAIPEHKPEEKATDIEEEKIMKCIKKYMSKEKKAAVKPQPIDWGKAVALHNAGWNMQAIASELHTNEETIKQGLVIYLSK